MDRWADTIALLRKTSRPSWAVRSKISVPMCFTCGGLRGVVPRVVVRRKDDPMSECFQAPDEPFAGPFRVQPVEVVAAEFAVPPAATNDMEGDPEQLVGDGDGGFLDAMSSGEPEEERRK